MLNGGGGATPGDRDAAMRTGDGSATTGDGAAATGDCGATAGGATPLGSAAAIATGDCGAAPTADGDGGGCTHGGPTMATGVQGAAVAVTAPDGGVTVGCFFRLAWRCGGAAPPNADADSPIILVKTMRGATLVGRIHLVEWLPRARSVWQCKRSRSTGCQA